ncbi:MAG: glycosyltransferase family 1 protein [Chloroflexota bacterium]
MQIGIDARLNGYRAGGISEYTRHLIQALALVDGASRYCILHAARPQLANDDTADDLTPAANFRRVNVFTPPHHKLERVALAAEIARLRLDVLHSPDFIPPQRGAQHRVITVHDLAFLHYPQFQTADSVRYYAGHIRAAVREADHILAVSQTTAADLHTLLNVPAEKITVQLEGVDPAFRPLPVSEIRSVQQRLGLPSSYLLFVGTFEPRKNLPGLLEAYHALCQILPDAPPLVIAGTRGWLYEPIFQKAEELKLGQRLIWLEAVTANDLPAIYNGAVLFVLPSFYEGFGLPPLEAMACGIPTIVSNRGSLPEVVGETGLTVDPDQPAALTEALQCMLTDSELRERSATAGLTRAATFTWQHAAEVALSVYRKVAGC